MKMQKINISEEMKIRKIMMMIKIKIIINQRLNYLLKIEYISSYYHFYSRGRYTLEYFLS
jgi:hypothetical protein